MQDKRTNAASKAGVIGFTKSVALELGSRTSVATQLPFIETEMTAKLNDDVVQGWRDGISVETWRND
jgi:3-oxoacyl-[acyl-carrier protein] reductase